MNLLLARRIFSRLKGRYNSTFDLKKRYELIKESVEDIDDLKRHPSWRTYERNLVNKLLASYDGLKQATDMQQLSFYQGRISILENILTIPQILNQKEKNMYEHIQENENERQSEIAAMG